MQVYVQPRVIRTPSYVRTSIHDYVPHDSDVSTAIPPYPYVSTANAARLDVNPRSSVPRHPEEKSFPVPVYSSIVDLPVPTSLAWFISLTRTSVNHGKAN